MNQVFSKTMMCVFLMVLMVGTVSAMDWDNVITYEKDNKVAVFDNWLGLGATIGRAELMTPSVNHVIEGKNRRVMEFEIDNYGGEYKGGLKDMEIVNLNTGKTEKKTFHYEFAVYDWVTYNLSYDDKGVEDNILGKDIAYSRKVFTTETVDVWDIVEWVDFGGDIPSGVLRVALVTDVRKGDKYDGFPIIFGKKVGAWAVWDSSFDTNLFYWGHFNETVGVVTNEISAFNDGTVTNALSKTNDCISKNCYWFDGAGDYIRIADDNETFDFGANDFTINYWANGSAYGGASGIISRDWNDGGSTNGMWLLDFAGNNAYISVGGGWDISGVDMGALTANVWSMRTITRSGDNWTFWRNGLAYNDVAQAGTLGNLADDVGFGECQAGTGNHVGRLDELGIWKGRALSNTEISDLYDSGTGMFFSPTDDAPVVVLSVPANNTISGTGIITFNCSATDVVGTLSNLSLWINGVANYSETTAPAGSFSIEKEVTFNTDARYNWTCKGWDGTSTGVAPSWNFTVDKTAPVVSVAINITDILTPILPVNSSWNYTVADNIELDDCYYTTSDNATISFITCNVSDIKTQWQTEGSKTITYCANDTANSETCRVGTLDVDYYSYGQNGSIYVTEGTSHTFTLKINNTAIPTTSVRFMFNGTAYAPTTTVSSVNTYNFTKDFTIPDGLGNSSGKNDTWYWAVNLTTKAKFNTTFQNVSILSVEFDNCTNFGTIILNFSLRDEGSDSLVTISPTQNTTVELDMQLSNWDDSSFVWDFSTSWTNETNITVCVPDGMMTGTDTAFDLDITEVRYFADNYVTEFYYADNYNLSNQSIPRYIALRDLLADDSTSFVVSYTGSNNLLVENAIISLQRKYEDAGEFRDVENGKTSNDGETILHLVEEDVVYRFNVTIDGIDEWLSDEWRVYCEAGATCVVTLDKSSEVEHFPDVWDNLPEGTYNISVDSDTRRVTLSWNLNETTTLNLTIYQYSQNDSVMDIAIVSNKTTASEGSTYVDIPMVYGNQTFYATVYADGVWVASHFVDLVSDFTSWIGLPLVALMVALIVMSLGLMSVSQGVGVIIFGVFGVMVSVFMGFFTSSGAWSVVSIIIAGLIVIGMIYKRRARV